jgi:predicted ester cyclase
MAASVEVHRAAHEAFNSREWGRLRTLTAADVMYVDHPRGLILRSFEELRDAMQQWTAGMSDARVEECRYLDAGTHSVCRFAGRGTNDGPLGPAQATGQQMDLAFCEIVRVEDDRIVEGEILYDAMTMMSQFGVVSAPVAA